MKGVALLDFLFSARREPRPAPLTETETVRKIVDSLDRLDVERARYLAAFAYVLSRVARADLNVSAGETRAMERVVMEHGGLPEDQAILVVQIAKNQNLLFGATEDFLVTREFDKIANREQKMALLDCLFRVAAAEEWVSAEEDHEIRRVSRELGLSHEEFISVRSRFRDQLSVLRKEDESK
jgi:uncharacterized tellurite resistance protein B-like protein